MAFFLFLHLFMAEGPSAERALKAHIQFLADDLLEGREATYPGQKIAARYIASHFQKLGLEQLYANELEPYEQDFILYRPRLDPEKSQLALEQGSVLKPGRDFHFLGGNPEPGEISLEAVFVGFGYRSKKHGWDDYSDMDVKGKYLLVLDGFPPKIAKTYKDSNQRRAHLRKRKVKWGQKAGAKGMIFLPARPFSLADRRPELKTSRGFGTGRLSLIPVRGPSNIFPIIDLEVSGFNGFSKALQDRLIETVKVDHEKQKPKPFFLKESLGSMRVALEDGALETENVVGMVPGIDENLRDQYVVVSAHYDHIGAKDGNVFNGADDNASGTALLMELATQVAAKPLRRSVIFLAAGAEEKGLLGSSVFVDQPPVPLENIVANLNIDMVGRNKTDEIGIIPAQNQDVTSLNHWVKVANQKMENPFTFLEDLDQYHQRSDHYNFVRKEIPSLFFFSGTHEDYHRASDEWPKLDFIKVHRVYRLVRELLIMVGDQDQKPVFTAREEVETLDAAND